jgi:hypothetical protein
MNNNEYSIIMTRIITELLPQGNLDSSRGDSQGSHIIDYAARKSALIGNTVICICIVFVFG